jgi:hypothetical protein
MIINPLDLLSGAGAVGPVLSVLDPQTGGHRTQSQSGTLSIYSHTVSSRIYVYVNELFRALDVYSMQLITGCIQQLHCRERANGDGKFAGKFDKKVTVNK